MASDDLTRLEAKLDLLIAIQRAAHAEGLETLAEELKGDPVVKAALQATKSSWTGAGRVKEVVSRTAQGSKATIERRLADLVDRGVLLRRGSGPAVEYRASGLIDL